jgi:hypothetical protein
MTHEQKYNHIVQTTIKMRGVVLHQMSHLEKAIDNYIIYHLTDRNDEFKVSQMQLLIFGDNRITLESKRQIFTNIAENHDSKWYKSYQPIRKIQAKKGTILMNKDLVYVIEQRNVFAHCVPATTQKAYDNLNEVGFLKFKDKPEHIFYSNEKFIELETTIVALSRYIALRSNDSEDNIEKK